MPAHNSALPIDVNLLPKDPFAESGVGKFLSWALSIGRYIVVFTELIVILTFLSRFTLDRQLTDLNEDLIAKQALLESYTQLETDIRAIQTKGKFIEQIENQPKIYPTLDFILNNIPNNIELTDVNIRQDRLVINAYAYNSKALSQLVDILEAQPGLSNIHLDQFSTEENDARIEFIIRTDLET